jgi:hypothetical protein
MKSKRNEKGEFAACMEDRRGAYRVRRGNLRARDHLKILGQTKT